MAWFDAYVTILSRNPFRVTRADLIAFYNLLWVERRRRRTRRAPSHDPLAYIAWFKKALGPQATHIDDVFRHVLHEFTAAEHARMMREAVNGVLP
jgi:hypothetical protein